MLAAVGGLGGRSARVGSLGDGGAGGGAFRGAAAPGGVSRLRKQSSAEGSGGGGGSEGGHGGTSSSGSTAQPLPHARPPTPSSAAAATPHSTDHHASGLLPNLHLNLHRPGGVAGRAASIDAGFGSEGGPMATTPQAGAGGMAVGFAGTAAAARAGAVPSAHAVAGGGKAAAAAAGGVTAAAGTPRVNPGIISVGGVGATGAARLARRDSLTGAAASAGAVLAARAVATGGGSSSGGAPHVSGGSLTPQPSPMHQGSAAGSGHFARRASDVGTAPHSSAYLQLHSGGTVSSGSAPGGGTGGKARPGDTPPVPVPGGGPRLTPAHRSGSTASLPSTQGLTLPPPALSSLTAAAAGGPLLQHSVGPSQSSALLPALIPLHASGASQQGQGQPMGGLASPSHRPMLSLLAVSTRGIAIGQQGQQGLGGVGGVAAAMPSAAGRPSLLSFAQSSAGGSSSGSGAGPPAAGQAVAAAAAAADRPRVPPGGAAQQHPQPHSLLLRSSSLLVGGSSGADSSMGAATGSDYSSESFAGPLPGAAGGAPRQRPRLLSHTSAAAAAGATAAAAATAAPATAAAAPVPFAGGGSIGSDLVGLGLASPHRPASGVSSVAGGGGSGGRDDEGGSGAGSPARIPSPLGRRRLSSGLVYAAGSSWGGGGGGVLPLPSAVPPQRQEASSSSTSHRGRLAPVHTEADATAGLSLDNEGEGDEESGDAAALAALSAALPPSRFAFPPASARGGGNADSTTAASYATVAEAVMTGAEAAAIFDSVSPSSPTRDVVNAALAATGASAGGGAVSPFAGLEATGNSGLGLSLSLPHRDPRGGPPSARGAASPSIVPAHAAPGLDLSLSLTAATASGGVGAATAAAAASAVVVTPSLATGAP